LSKEWGQEEKEAGVYLRQGMKANVNKFWRRSQAHGRPAAPHAAADVPIAISLAIQAPDVRKERRGPRGILVNFSEHCGQNLSSGLGKTDGQDEFIIDVKSQFG
jgi:hypothetical protein